MLDKINKQVKRSGPAISIHKFKLLKNKEEYVFLFVEGEDDLYFYPQNAQNIFSNKQVLPLSCDGKDGVIEVNEILYNDINDSITVGFFVDRDFDEKANDLIPKNVYITPTYSVENLVYNQSTFINLLIGRFSLTPAEDEFNKCMSLYEDMSTKFYASIHLYNSWIYAQRNYITTKKELNLPKNLPKDFVKFQHLNIVPNYDLAAIEALHTKAPKLDKEKLDLALVILNEELPEKRFRGKFNWALFSYIIGLLIDDANNNNDWKYLSKKVKFNISRKDSRKLFEEISPFAKPPQCLLNYFGAMAA